ncbi:hypothetical protein B7755_015160 [Streptomyces sp. NBS 14/10]|uniref:hypothetical protein n=1 Tax=Streptomyces sp. NBS 14/10 TaxID=1945643 RepID=UPI00117D6B96|nr:hypothetical protein [Streptomyces sp. NBS 14/10]KAK1179364.1 hypothetical protein B7755_015160 [Streptomyces sp. NBS 14/10]
MRPAPHPLASPAEPVRGAGRPSRVLLVSLRRAVSATLLAASLTTLSAACGQQHAAVSAPPNHRADGGTPSSPPGTPFRQGRVDSGLAYFTSAPGSVRQVRAVLRGPDELKAFARLFRGREQEIIDRAGATDFSRTTLVGWSATTGCAQWPSATLHRAGDTLKPIAGPHPEPPPECYAPFHVIAVFEVPRDRLPVQPRFAD